MTENRIRELRRSHNMSQEALGTIINTTQQAVSKMEKRHMCHLHRPAYQHGKVF